MRSMKFSSYPMLRLQPTTFNSPFIPSRPVTLNSFAAFADTVDQALAGYAAGGSYYNSIATKYGVGVANQVAAAAASGDRGSMSVILGSAIPLGQPGGGSVQSPLDDSTSDIFWDQIYNEPLVAPIEQVNKILTSAGKSVASSSGITGALTLAGVGLLAWFVLAHNH